MIRILQIVPIILFLFCISSCQRDYGNLLESEELDVYYSDKEDEAIAREIALYFKKHDFLGTKKQYLQLNRLDKGYALFMVHSEGFDRSKVSFDEQKSLLDLQDSLQALIPGKPMSIVISNNNFEPVWDINN